MSAALPHSLPNLAVYCVLSATRSVARSGLGSMTAYRRAHDRVQWNRTSLTGQIRLIHDGLVLNAEQRKLQRLPDQSRSTDAPPRKDDQVDPQPLAAHSTATDLLRASRRAWMLTARPCVWFGRTSSLNKMIHAISRSGFTGVARYCVADAMPIVHNILREGTQ